MADLDAEGSEILYTRNRERPLLQHVLGYIMVFPHQGIVQGCISEKFKGVSLIRFGIIESLEKVFLLQ